MNSGNISTTNFTATNDASIYGITRFLQSSVSVNTLSIVTNSSIISSYNQIATGGDVGLFSGSSSGVSCPFVIAPFAIGPSGLRMSTNGNISIGKTSADYLLDVNGDIRVGTTTNANIRLCSSGIGTTQAAYISSSTTNNNMVIMNQQVGNLFLGTYGNIRATISSNGNVGIGTVAPVYNLDVSGSIRATGNVSIGGTLRPGYTLDVSGNVRATQQIIAASFNATSDYRMKNNVQPLIITRTIDVLKPIEYDLNGGSHDMGFLAHEVQEHFPFLVLGEKDGPEKQSLNYNGFIALLVKEIQELKRENKSIKERLYLLECKGASMLS